MNEKIYLQEEFINQNWHYQLNGNNIIVHTNNNCYTNYNTTYCDCYSINTSNHYMYSDLYSCSNSNSYNIRYNRLTSDFWYRNDIMDICIVFSLIAIGFLILPCLFFRRFRKR